MQGLHGDFHTMPLKDVVLYLGNKRATGSLTIETGAVRKEVDIREGLVISASSNQSREYLGQFLINMGRLTEDQFNKAYKTQKETRVFLGKILVMIGLVSEEVVRSAIGVKLRETLLDPFTWPEGEFTFTQVRELPAPDGLECPVDLLDILREAEFRETAWQAIRAAFPRGSLRLTVDESRLPEPPRPGTLDFKLVEQIREGQTIDDMILAMHATDFFVYQRLYALYRLGAVKVDESAAPAEESEVGLELGDEQTDAEIARAAEAFLDAGNFRDAEPLARRAFELRGSPEHRELLKRAETGLLAELRAALVARRQVAALAIPAEAVKAQDLSAAEKYLLSRVDGTRDVMSIVQVSPLQELEALKLFAHFVSAGLVRLAPG